MNTANLLALVMQKQRVDSFRKIGKLIGVTGANVARWAREEGKPTDAHIVELCRLSGQDPAHWIVSIRFNSANPQARTAWAKIYTAVNERKTLPLT